jgi:hypothetical protein
LILRETAADSADTVAKACWAIFVAVVRFMARTQNQRGTAVTSED